MTQIDFPEIVLKEVRQSLISTKTRVSTAESVTAGFLQLACSQMERATEIFAGGVTAYSIDTKINTLEVDAEVAERCDCVSPTTTEEMALAAGRMFHTDWSVATTGYATVVPESKGKLFAFVSVAYKQEILLTSKIELSSTIGMLEAQFRYSIKALEILNTLLKNKGSQ